MPQDPNDALARSVRSFPARMFYLFGPQFPPALSGVDGAIDLHCHAHEGQQDALALAKFASLSGMAGILFKTIVGRPGPVEAVREVEDALAPWAEAASVAPVRVFAGCMSGPDWSISPDYVRRQLELGAAAVWLPVINHANTLEKVGGRTVMWDADAHPDDYQGPMIPYKAERIGHRLLDEHGRLLPNFSEIVRMVADHGAALFFGHATHDEISVLAEEVERLGITQAVIDHPFSPFVDLDVARMTELAGAGITFNFTFDELSPALGIDPGRMVDAICAVGPAHCTLSSDAGDALFPHSVECMRLMRAYMSAYGMTDAEVEEMSCTNPARILGSKWPTARTARVSAAE